MSPTALAHPTDVEMLQRQHFGDVFLGAADRWTRLVDRANARRVCRVLARRLARGASVLEIGPGRGAVLAALAGAGFRVQGLELSPAVAEAVSRHADAPVLVGTLEQCALNGRNYDAVVARHVLEHMLEPLAAVEALHALLAPGGLAYVATPNIGAPESVLPGWTGYQPYHLHYFTPARLRRLFEQCGFMIVRLRTSEPFSGWFNAVVNSLRPRPTGGDDVSTHASGTVVAVYNLARFFIGGVMTPLRLAQACGGRGEEIEIVARKLGRE